MVSRDARIKAEAKALWRTLNGDAPPAQADGAELLDMMLSRLPDVGYERLNSPFLRQSGLSSWRAR
jgi:hypothetical protein